MMTGDGRGAPVAGREATGATMALAVAILAASALVAVPGRRGRLRAGASTAHRATVWLCRPGQRPDPCAFPRRRRR